VLIQIAQTNDLEIKNEILLEFFLKRKQLY
jgi:hypothetical protein